MTCPSIVRNGRIFYRFASCYVHTIHPKCPLPEFDAKRPHFAVEMHFSVKLTKQGLSFMLYVSRQETELQSAIVLLGTIYVDHFELH